MSSPGHSDPEPSERTSRTPELTPSLGLARAHVGRPVFHDSIILMSRFILKWCDLRTLQIRARATGRPFRVRMYAAAPHGEVFVVVDLDESAPIVGRIDAYAFRRAVYAVGQNARFSTHVIYTCNQEWASWVEKKGKGKGTVTVELCEKDVL